MLCGIKLLHLHRSVLPEISRAAAENSFSASPDHIYPRIIYTSGVPTEKSMGGNRLDHVASPPTLTLYRSNVPGGMTGKSVDIMALVRRV